MSHTGLTLWVCVHVYVAGFKLCDFVTIKHSIQANGKHKFRVVQEVNSTIPLRCLAAISISYAGAEFSIEKKSGFFWLFISSITKWLLSTYNLYQPKSSFACSIFWLFGIGPTQHRFVLRHAHFRRVENCVTYFFKQQCQKQNFRYQFYVSNTQIIIVIINLFWISCYCALGVGIFAGAWHWKNKSIFELKPCWWYLSLQYLASAKQLLTGISSVQIINFCTKWFVWSLSLKSETRRHLVQCEEF